MYVSDVALENLKAVRQSTLRFSLPDPDADQSGTNMNLLLGNNGTGKTTILSAIALSVLAPIIKNSGYFARNLVTFGQETGAVSTTLTLNHVDAPDEKLPSKGLLVTPRLDLLVRRQFTELNWRSPSPNEGDLFEAIYDEQHPAFFLLGYGATRRVDRAEDSGSREKSRSVRYQRVAGLFEDHYALVPIQSWFLKLGGGKRRSRIIDLFNDLLPDELRFTGDKDEEKLFRHYDVEMPFEALSDGYRAYVGLIGDILYHMNELEIPDIRDVHGTILIDEIDLHLHPKWQRDVLDRLSRNLPKIQFIITTHSPIVAGTMRNESLLVLQRNEEGQIGAMAQKSGIYGQSADQILTSDHFGLETTRAPGPALALRQQSKKAMQGLDGGNVEEALEYLRMINSDEHEVFDQVEERIVRPVAIKQGRGIVYNGVVRAANWMDERGLTTLLGLVSLFALLIGYFIFPL